MDEPLRIRVTVAYSPAPRDVCEWQVLLDAGATVSNALEASGLRAEFPDRQLEAGMFGVWGRKVQATHILREGDRVEVYRALTVDPKVARRERFRKQGSRAAGLFARKRSGAKAGY